MQHAEKILAASPRRRQQDDRIENITFGVAISAAAAARPPRRSNASRRQNAERQSATIASASAMP